MHPYLRIGSTPSPFDIRWQTVHPPTPISTLPPTVSLSHWLGVVKNQGQEGSCTAQSGCSIMEWLIAKAEGQTLVLSPAMLYEVERILEGEPDKDIGARLRVTQYALQTVGVCREALDPYTPQDFLVRLTPDILNDATHHRIRHGFWAPSLTEILGALAFGVPVQIGIVVTQSFESAAVAATGQVPMPTPDDPILGGHALVAYGYSIPHRVVMVRNSWGEDWGNHGNCEIPFEYFENPRWLMSARVYTLD